MVTEKQRLLQVLRDMGVDEDHIEWMAKRKTAKDIQISITNMEAYDIIARVAKRIN